MVNFTRVYAICISRGSAREAADNDCDEDERRRAAEMLSMVTHAASMLRALASALFTDALKLDVEV